MKTTASGTAWSVAGSGIASATDRLRSTRRVVFRSALRSVLRSVLHAVLSCGLVLALAASVPARADADGTKYLYDEVGRLVEVIDAAGNIATYQYDAAGNIVAVRRTDSGQLSVAEFTPGSGPVGSSVSIFGSGFSATPSGNTVKFNSIKANVSSASSTKLVATVPAAATTGAISVTVGSATATSVEGFTVTKGSVAPAPVIAGFSPKIGVAGTAVTVTGKNFSATAGDNAVSFNALGALVGKSTATQIQTTVPVGATSGPIKVRTPYGSAVSTADFFVPPDKYTVDQIGVTGRLVVDGAAGVFTDIGADRKIALFLFDGVEGQSLGLGIGPATFRPANGAFTVFVKTPKGKDLVASSGFWGPRNLSFPDLPSTGTYTILVVPISNSVLDATMMMSTDTVATLSAGQPRVFDNSGRIGKNGWYGFNATMGQSSCLTVGEATFAGNVTVYKPDGSWLAGSAFSAGTQDRCIDLARLPATGTYTVFVAPSGTDTGSVKLKLLPYAVGDLSVDGPPAQASLAAGQKGEYRFSGVTGQKLGLGVSDLTTTASRVVVKVYGPGDGRTPLVSCGSFSSTAGGGECDLDALPRDGVYSVRMEPDGINAASFTLTLSNDVEEPLAIGGAAQTFKTVRVGQNGRYAFHATAGDTLTLSWSASTFPNNNNFVIRQPDGKVLRYYTFGGTDGTLELQNLSATGTYEVFVDPYQTAVGSIALGLKRTGKAPPPPTEDGDLLVDGTELPSVFRLPTHRHYAANFRSC